MWILQNYTLRHAAGMTPWSVCSCSICLRTNVPNSISDDLQAERPSITDMGDQPMTSGNNNFALSVIQGMLFGRATTGARCLVFTEDKTSLSYLASLHGITLSSTATVMEYQRVILSHVLLGQCFKRLSLERTLHVGIRNDVSTCLNIASGFQSVAELCKKLLDYVLSYSERGAHLTSSKLKIILAAVRLINKHLSGC